MYSKCSLRVSTDAITSRCASTIDQPAHITWRGRRTKYTSGRGRTPARSVASPSPLSLASACSTKRLDSFVPASLSAPGRCSAITLRLIVSCAYERLAMMK